MKYIFLISSIFLLTGCQNVDNLLYKYGNGVKSGIDGAAEAIACVAVGLIVCSGAAAVKGYIEGKQEARQKIIDRENAQLIKNIAEKQKKCSLVCL